MSYEKLYNAPGSRKKADQSWARYMDITPERYTYAIDQLYGDVLDVGAGDGFGAYLMQQNKNIDSITCIEIQDESIDKMRLNLDNITIIKDVIECIELDKKFDSVYCGHTLEHVEDLDRALIGIKRHAKDRVVISVPINGGISHIHVREFKKIEDVKDELSKYFDLISFRVFAGNVSSVVFINKNRDERK